MKVLKKPQQQNKTNKQTKTNNAIKVCDLYVPESSL